MTIGRRQKGDEEEEKISQITKGVVHKLCRTLGLVNFLKENIVTKGEGMSLKTLQFSN